MNSPVVIIRTGGSLESFYNGIREMLDQKYHIPGNSFPSVTISAAEQTDQSTLAAYAASFDTSSGPPPGVPLERWIR